MCVEHRTSRKRPRSASTVGITLKRACRPKAPVLPVDVWHSVANYISPTNLVSLGRTNSVLHEVTTSVLRRKLWHAVFPSTPYDAVQAVALHTILSLLGQAPSMKVKHIDTHVELLCVSRDLIVPIPSIACFTKEEARTFLHVDAPVLSRMPVARAASRSSSLHFPEVKSFLRYQMSLPRKDASLYSLGAILRAAMITHGNLNALIPLVKKAVEMDKLQYDRAWQASRFIHSAASAYGLTMHRLEYCLGACSQVQAFRGGLWEKSYDEYVPLVVRLMKMHLKLGKCYRFLLHVDGNARLKAKRLLVKLLRTREFSVNAYAKSLQANLWWAKSQENLRKMRRHSRGLN